MTYEETLSYLYARLPMFQRIGQAAYKADLSNTLALMDLTGHPERGLRCIHVAGTNGKGSTCHMLASILQESGYKVGLHTSPHLKDFRERIRIDGAMIPEDEVVRFVERFRSGFEPIHASFFEWGVALALWWFKEQQVDIAVIETGMGGRLDSTNVVTPEVSVITNIGLDHMQFLGTTLEAIAGEKAGIIKPGIPVVIGEAGSVGHVFEAQARRSGSKLVFAESTPEPSTPLGLEGAHQRKNARTVLATLSELRTKGWVVQEEAVPSGLRNVVLNTGFAGRWQRLEGVPPTIVDVAHNEDGIRAMLAQLAQTKHRALHVVLGMVNDKDFRSVLSLLPPSATYYFCKADIPRGMDAALLQESGAANQLQGEAFASVAHAFNAARNSADPEDLILVTGSVFVVAEVL